MKRVLSAVITVAALAASTLSTVAVLLPGRAMAEPSTAAKVRAIVRGEKELSSPGKQALGMALFVTGTATLLAGSVMTAEGADCRPTYYAVAVGDTMNAPSCLATHQPLLSGGLVAVVLGSGVLVTGIVLRLDGRPPSAASP